MSTLSDILNTGRQALLVHQLAMQVVGQNTANVNTEGYSRRTLQLTTSPPYDGFSSFEGGMGVDVQYLGRVRDRLLDEQIRRNNAQLGYWGQRNDVLSRVEEIFSELGGNAISDQLQQFWAAWSDLSNSPEGTAGRIALLEKAQSLTSNVRRVYGELVAQRDQVDDQIVAGVAEVNQLTSQIARLNVQIVRSETSGQEASNLRDERDTALDRLSRLMNISIEESANGSVNVYNGGQILVQVDRSVDLVVSSVNRNGSAVSVVTYGHSGRTLSLDGGELKALFDLRDGDIGRTMDALDEFAVTLATRVNDIHRAGYGLTNSNGIEFFADDIIGAANFRLSSLVVDDPSRVATAASSDSPGDNSIALQIASLQNAKLMREGRLTLGEFYRDSVLSLSSSVSYASSQLSVEQAAMDNLENRRQQVSGVSLDEEMTKLVQVQQAYEAAARIVNTVDEMMQTVLALGGAS